MRRRDTIRRVSDLIYWENLLDERMTARLQGVECPPKVMGVEAPKSLEGLTFEALCKLWSVGSTEEWFVAVGDVFLNLPREKVLRAKVLPMLGLANWVAKEMERVNGLWEAIPSTHSPEELMAGCKNLNFGVFGIADWYARRMGMTNHDEAMQTPWVRIYQCMKNDAEETVYRKRLNEIIIKNQHKK